jgi:hypothetical protein
MQATLNGKTAGGILKTATVNKTRAGTWEIFVTHPHDCVAMLGERKDGWGGTVRDVLVLTDASGCIARMSMSAKALAKLASLERQCEAKYA